MAMTAGTRLGPYELQALLGAGGMGEVYRARDTRLGREVAIKVLPASFSHDADRLRRFEQEARAAGILNHPNITIVYDIGQHEDAPYVVQELLEGESLRAVLAGGRLSPRKAIDYSIQIAQGLAAAHEKGIVHRDLKPENLFVTRDGRVKILDFGLAKLTHPEKGSQATDVPTATAGTEPGVVLGTLGYMSPEQVRGKSADARSDIFSFGAILYEMLSGKRAFHGDSAADTMSAILKEDPPDLSVTSENISPGLERIVRHCLEKNPEQRFHSAHDLAFDLEALSGASSPRGVAAGVSSIPRKSRLAAGAIAACLLAALALGIFLGTLKKAGPPRFRQLTFRRGTIVSARFAPDGQTIVYGAAWDGRPFEVFSTLSESPISRPLGLPSAEILAISSSGQLALSLGRRFTTPYIALGTLAESPLGGGAPRELLENVLWADWAPNGRELAVVRDAGGRNRLEFPIGKPLYETAGHVSHPRFSRQGDLIAFLDHGSRGADDGAVAVVDRNGRKRDLSPGWDSLWGLAWSPKGDEVWFTGARTGGLRALYAVSRSGRERLIERIAGQLTLADVSRDGRVLLLNDPHRLGMLGTSAGQASAWDLTYLDYSATRDLSGDGTRLLFDEPGGGGGPTGAVYLRKMDGSAPVRLGDGISMALSPDAGWALSSFAPPDERQFVLLPTGVGEPRRLPARPGKFLWADWLPNGKEILFDADEPGRGSRLYLQDVATGRIRPISGEGVTLLFYSHLITPDSRFVAAFGPDQRIHLYPLGAGDVREIPGLAPGEEPIRWSADGRLLYVYRPGELPARIARLEVETGAREPFKELLPSDPAGVVSIRPPLLTPDGSVCVYSYSRFLSELFLVEGLR
jgi:serine/threonine protein kinase/Tol biopolymer transport system component